MRLGNDLHRKASWLFKALLSAFRRENGNVTPIIAIMLVPIIGAFAIATETSSWLLTKRAMQHAADSAALAAATNNSKLSTSTPTAGTSDTEAKAVATKYSYTDGVGNTTVTVTMPTCPSPYTSGNCYQVTISRNVPIRLARIVGYNGDVAIGTGRGKTITATSIARAGSKGTICITALGSDPAAITLKGVPSMDLTGCDVASAGGASCQPNPGVGNAYVTNDGDKKDCGTEHVGSGPTDIYASLKTNIPAPDCSSGYSVKTPTAAISSNVTYCGGVKLDKNVTVNGDVVMYIPDGNLEIPSGFTLSTSSGSHLTIIFTGTVGGTASHIFTGGGTLDIAAPTTGVWSGIALYTDPRLTTGSFDMTDVGNSPTYNVTGLLYMPFSAVTIKGAINHKSGGDNCMGMVVKTLDIRGTGGIFSTPASECDRAGLTLAGPAGTGYTPLLVQ